MCGLVGLLSTAPLAEGMLAGAIAALRHRGPDDQGHWLSGDRMTLIGHTRLAILDLTAAGHQPMTSADARFVLAFNGEIYNHAALRAELARQGEAPAWRGHSDTETLLAAITAWGLEATLRRARGMWALALWDQRTQRLQLARDRFGEKPLYYGFIDGGFAFASQLGALRTLPGFRADADLRAVGQLLSLGYIPAPLSIYAGVSKLRPGTILTLDRAGAPVETCYYDFAAEAAAGAADPITDYRAGLSQLEPSLSEAVAGQLVADVPIGTFLSGGIDSSLITALAARASSAPVQTFSIGFAEQGFDEAPYARAVAAALGTDHHELYVTAADAREVIPGLPLHYDEPFGDHSQIPTCLLSRFARGAVTVALSGDGGDELFGGYNRHRALPRTWRRLSALPPSLRPALRPLATIPGSVWNLAGRISSGRKRPDFLGDKVRHLLQAARQSDDFERFVQRFLDRWTGAQHPIADAVGPAPALLSPNLPLETRLMAADTLSYLPDDILVKVDRATMAVGLEGRMPFLDHEVARIATRLPLAAKIGAGGGKRILRDLLSTMIAPALFERPKAGFAMPLGDWLRTDLRDWTEELLRTLPPMIDPVPIRKSWADHLARRTDASERLWPVLMLQAWQHDQAARWPNRDR
ncbi:asparagine synthase (glutamine-hydrolyzing) [Sphingomonas sp.]|uniref:asparagine synthase (glutamine-hydrolyzing) n=1 Tax=Sphingomonas sp. TaxID=28214 RepID=UPI003B3B72CF